MLFKARPIKRNLALYSNVVFIDIEKCKMNDKLKLTE